MARRKRLDPRLENVRIEYTRDAIPIEKALTSLARVIARGMYDERHGKKNGERAVRK